MTGPCVESRHVQVYVAGIVLGESRQQRSSRIIVVGDDFNAACHCRSRSLGMRALRWL